MLAISFVLAKSILSKKIIKKENSDGNNNNGQWPQHRRHHKVNDEVIFNPFAELENVVEDAVSEIEELADKRAATNEWKLFEDKANTARLYDVDGRVDVLSIGKPSAVTKDAQMFFIDYPKCSIAGSTSLIYNNMVMIDSGSFTRSFGMDSLYNREKLTLTILYGDNTLIYNLKNNDVKFNNEVVETDQYAVYFNDLIFIPLPFTAEIFGIGVKINQNDRIIEVG